MEDALEEVRTILLRTDDSIRLEDGFQRLDVNQTEAVTGAEEFDNFLGSTPDEVKLTETERTRVNLLIPIIRLCRLLSLRLVNPTQPNLSLLKSIPTEQIEKFIHLIESFPEHIDELVSELDLSPHSKALISKTLDELLADSHQLISGLKVDQIGLDGKDLKWFGIWKDQMKNASSALLEAFD
ncbi:uncharacterized protein MELLADRAFT_101103 [Melampsora larici-populina 98AG31]|uniref:Uncharacterized protein n=1 Tax=Melampsora larici-populina (strain 98AG31 / pathotype 3-4-7) TaxID=747676 RepID=F4R3M3_MELLP|nr:uncharacterized protein MELLADRAFT_101103 [Melampsora larici-populina 98AG31]EGG12654.1 hypothetical protein MELLADRAFT_101103 [Melampsora larici-populina 98AG31]